MTSQDNTVIKFRISEALKIACSVLIKNIGSLLVFSVLLFVAFDVLYDSIEVKFLEYMQHPYIKTHIENFMQLEFVQGIMDSYKSFSAITGTEGPPLLTIIFFSFLLPVAVIRILFASPPSHDTFTDKAYHYYSIINSKGFIVSSLRYVSLLVGALFIFICIPYVLAMVLLVFYLAVNSNWIWCLFILFVLGYVYFLLRFTAVVQLAYVAIALDNLDVWNSLKRGYLMSSSSWLKISTIFFFFLPLLLTMFTLCLGVFSLVLGLGDSATVLSSRLIEFIFVTFSAILSAVCYDQLSNHDHANTRRLSKL